MSALLVRRARLLDSPDAVDLRFTDGVLTELVPAGSPGSGGAGVVELDALGAVLAPALTDLAVRLRDEAAELRAAARGGVGRLVCMPDTSPVLDEPRLVEMLRHRAEGIGLSHVHPLGALTRGLQGELVSELARLARAGCIGFTQCDQPISDTQTLLRCMQYAASNSQTVWLRAQDASLGRGGVVASGALALRLGLSGVPASAETVALFTLFELVRATGCRLHICRLSSAQGVQMLRAAKAQGLAVTADVSLHNLTLTELDVGYFDPHFRMEPVLRGTADRDALRAGLADGTIDALVSDHRPVSEDEKLVPFESAAPGASAVELLLPMALQFGQSAGLSLQATHDLCGNRARAVLGLAPEAMALGFAGEWMLFDPGQPWQLGVDTMVSQSKSSPFLGYELQGRVMAVGLRGALHRF